MKLTEYLYMREDAGPMIKQLKLACKELELKNKLKLGAFNNDEMVIRCVKAFNITNSFEIIEALEGIISNAKLGDASSLTRYLKRIKSIADGTLFSSSQLDNWIESFIMVAHKAYDVKEHAVAMKSMMEVLTEMWQLTRHAGVDPHKVAFAKANLKSLGITK
jgi:hypothetical protein